MQLHLIPHRSAEALISQKIGQIRPAGTTVVDHHRTPVVVRQLADDALPPAHAARTACARRAPRWDTASWGRRAKVDHSLGLPDSCRLAAGHLVVRCASLLGKALMYHVDGGAAVVRRVQGARRYQRGGHEGLERKPDARLLDLLQGESASLICSSSSSGREHHLRFGDGRRSCGRALAARWSAVSPSCGRLAVIRLPALSLNTCAARMARVYTSRRTAVNALRARGLDDDAARRAPPRDAHLVGEVEAVVALVVGGVVRGPGQPAEVPRSFAASAVRAARITEENDQCWTAGTARRAEHRHVRRLRDYRQAFIGSGSQQDGGGLPLPLSQLQDRPATRLPDSLLLRHACCCLADTNAITHDNIVGRGADHPRLLTDTLRLRIAIVACAEEIIQRVELEHTHRDCIQRVGDVAHTTCCPAPRLSARARDRYGPLAGPVIVTCVQAISFIICVASARLTRCAPLMSRNVSEVQVRRSQHPSP